MSDRLVREPHRFSFFQAVRLLLSGAVTVDAERESNQKKRSGHVGTLSSIGEEPVRFRSHVGMQFAPTEIVGLRTDDDRGPEDEGDSDAAVELEVAFWGLVGPAGALPTHYTQLVIDRVHAKDTAMRDFFDLFAHRQLSFFYRAWEKYFPPAGYEASRRHQDPTRDLLHECLLALLGRGTKRVRDRLECSDDALIYYGGLFIDRPTAASLQMMVSDYLGMPARVLSLFGQWLVLPESERTRLGDLPGHCRLGVDTVVGGRTWDPTSRFRVQIGPVGLKEFEQLMPTGEMLIPICQFIRSYVGLEYDFDLQVILKAEDIPFCRFAGDSPAKEGDTDAEAVTETQVQPHLGWNTWLCSHSPRHDSEDAVFQHDGSPTR